MKNSMDDLRDHLFETIEALKDDEKPMDIDRAKAICGVSQQLVNTAKVEVQFLGTTGNVKASRFLESSKPQLPDYQSGDKQ